MLTPLIRNIALSLLILAMSYTVAWPSPQKTGSDVVSFSKKDQTLTVKLDNTPLHPVLQHLADQLPVTIILQGLDGQEALSRSFTNLSIELGIERLLQGHDYAIVYPRTHFVHPALPKEIIVLPRGTISKNPNSSESRIIMSPIIVQQNTLASDSTSNKKEQNSSLKILTSKIEAIVKKLDQQPTQNISQQGQDSQGLDSEIQAMARVLLEQAKSSTP